MLEIQRQGIFLLLELPYLFDGELSDVHDIALDVIRQSAKSMLGKNDVIDPCILKGCRGESERETKTKRNIFFKRIKEYFSHLSG